jgi:hypothetical protein
MHIRQRIAAAACATALAALAGCDGVQQVAQKSVQQAQTAVIFEDLKVLGRLYHDYHDAHNGGPPNWDAALEFARQQGGNVAAIERVRDAGYQVQWGMKFSQVTTGLANTVLAESGSGPKLMFDGSVQQ